MSARRPLRVAPPRPRLLCAVALVAAAALACGCAAAVPPEARTAPVAPIAPEPARPDLAAAPEPVAQAPVRRARAAYDPRLDGHVVLDVWCGDLGKAYCARCMEAQYASCMQDFVPACYSGRSPQMLTDRTLRHVAACTAALIAGSCTRASAGQLPPPCRPLH